MKSRRLAVLDLNDDPVKSLEAGVDIARHFDVRQFQSWKEVQRDLASSSAFAPDMILADIDFRLDASISASRFDGCGSAKPIGPMLALPYLNARPVTTFAFYSAHLAPGSQMLLNPWVLLPVGILAAKQEGGVFISSTLGGDDANTDVTVEKFIMELPKIGNPARALEEVVDMHVPRLFQALKSGRIRVTNGEEIRRRLETMKTEFGSRPNGCRLTVDPEISLEIFSPGYGVDRVQWLSLCADLVDFVFDDVDERAFRYMLSRAELLAGEDPAFQKALTIIRSQEESLTPDRFDKIAFKQYGGEPEAVRREILRLGVLLANVHAWAKAKFASFMKEDVYSRLGIPGASGFRTYQGWFGQRSNLSDPVVCGRTLKVRALPLFVQRPADYGSIFLEWGVTSLAEVDRCRIRHYLESFEESEGYLLPPGMPYLDPL